MAPLLLYALEFSTNIAQGFYNPVKDVMYEPALTGISYSFTDDGNYETAYYRAISNRALSYLLELRGAF